ncbi:hypothetical protein O4H48_22485, partial [Rhodobacteraceae bacterium G21628-S1]|nr:hypothetical protein [Rhodobacteraceae bacterium G21628-S1]
IPPDPCKARESEALPSFKSGVFQQHRLTADIAEADCPGGFLPVEVEGLVSVPTINHESGADAVVSA